jgi:hypothetical protein
MVPGGTKNKLVKDSMRPLIVGRSVSGFVMTTGDTIVKLK